MQSDVRTSKCYPKLHYECNEYGSDSTYEFAFVVLPSQTKFYTHMISRSVLTPEMQESPSLYFDGTSPQRPRLGI